MLASASAVSAGSEHGPSRSRPAACFRPQELGLLEAPDRDLWQRPDQIMDAMGIADASVVADVGAGSGWFTDQARAPRRPARHHLRPGRAGRDAERDHPARAARGSAEREADARPRQRPSSAGAVARRRADGGRVPRDRGSRDDARQHRARAQAARAHRRRRLQARRNRSRSRTSRNASAPTSS